ncbi:MAG TPA: hypothetical protein VGX23_20740 [Actinocrinis sp.]|nr:hypothetical protein [Actinocrinis sp.]
MQAAAATGEPAPVGDVPPPRRPAAGPSSTRAARRRHRLTDPLAPLVGVPIDGLGWSAAELTDLRTTAPGLEPGRIMACDEAGALVLTTTGAARATFCAPLLLSSARARAAGRSWPRPGDRVALRYWPDGPVTVEGVVAV